MNSRPLTKSRHLTCVAGNYLSLGPSGRRRGNYSSELSGQSELPFGRRQTVQRAGGLPRRSSPGPAGPLTCRRRKIGAHDALPSRRRFCVFWESAVNPPQFLGRKPKVPCEPERLQPEFRREIVPVDMDVRRLMRRGCQIATPIHQLSASPIRSTTVSRNVWSWKLLLVR